MSFGGGAASQCACMISCNYLSVIRRGARRAASPSALAAAFALARVGVGQRRV
jgi:hypothetical protein